MEYDQGGPLLQCLLLIGGQSSRMGSRKELLPLPDGRVSFEKALGTLHNAVPAASTIYISVHDETQAQSIETRLKDAACPLTRPSIDSGHDHEVVPFPAIKFLFDDRANDIGPAAGLLAAHQAYPTSKWLVLGCDYPLLPPSALQQLILEFKTPVTCFINEAGFAEPLIGIWDLNALGMLKKDVKDGKSGLNSVVKKLGGNTIKPLRENWILGTNSKEEWEHAMELLSSLGDISKAE